MSQYFETPVSGDDLPYAVQYVYYTTNIVVHSPDYFRTFNNGQCITPLPDGLSMSFSYTGGPYGFGIMTATLEGTPTAATTEDLNIFITFYTQSIDSEPTLQEINYWLIVLPFVDPPCIPTGQKVLTPNGNQPIETLKTGDYVLTPDGRSVKITMVSYSVPIVVANNAPISIPANTFGENSPINDIVLSPKHFIMIKPNVWDMPMHLINHYDGINKIQLGKSITYYNIITPNYLTDDIVVEGSVVESYGREFAKKYPGERQYYIYNDELKGYVKITMKDVLADVRKNYGGNRHN